MYNNQPDDPAGKRGAAVAWALSFMRDKGPVKMLDMEKRTPFPSISLAAFTNSRTYPIAEYAALFRSDTPDPRVKIQMVKKSIAESKPVIIAMNCPPSFNRAKEAWRPPEDSSAYYGGHAMCIVGYDDTKYNGAFEVQNSWGESLGNGGFIWIPYDVFVDFVWEAYSISENLGNYQQTITYSGFAHIEMPGGSSMAVTFQNGYYQTVSPYRSGTRFRYRLGNREAAYVYAFAADESPAAPTQLFPLPGSTVSPYLDYTENLIAFPGEFSWIQLDHRAGTDYLVVLYSKKELDIAAIRNRFSQEQGTFPDRVARAVGSDYIPPAQVQYEPNRLAFTAASANPNAVFGLLLVIPHQ